MKKYLNCVFLFSLLLSAWPAAAQQTGTPVLRYPDDLQYAHTYLHIRTYETGAALFRNLFRVNAPGQPMQTLMPSETFEVTSYEEIKNLEQTLVAHAGIPGRFYNALRIYYGLSRNDASGRYRLIYIYVPVVMHWQRATGGSQSDTNYIDEFEGDPVYNTEAERQRYYILQNGHFQAFHDTARVGQWRRNYREFIHIDERNSGQFRPFRATVPEDAADDGISETFSFKEINHFFGESDTLFISAYTNVGLMYGVSTFKHFLAFSNSADTGVRMGYTMAADLGTMCPPNCLVTRVYAGYTQPNKNNPPHPGVPRDKENRLLWILVISGVLLAGFVTGRLVKK